MFISSIRNGNSYCSLHWVLLLRKTIENHSVEPSFFLSLTYFPSKYFSSDQSLSHVQLFATP